MRKKTLTHYAEEGIAWFCVAIFFTFGFSLFKLVALKMFHSPYLLDADTKGTGNVTDCGKIQNR